VHGLEVEHIHSTLNVWKMDVTLPIVLTLGLDCVRSVTLSSVSCCLSFQVTSLVLTYSSATPTDCSVTRYGKPPST